MARRNTSRQRQKGQATPQTWDEKIVRLLIEWQREIGGLLVILFAVITFLGLIGVAGSTPVNVWTNFLGQLAGWGSIPAAILLAAGGLTLVLRRVELPYYLHPGQLIGIELLLVAALALSHVVGGGGINRALQGKGGGLIGWALSEPIVDFLGWFLSALLLLGVLTIGILLIAMVSWGDIVRWLNRVSVKLMLWSNEMDADLARNRVPAEDTNPDAAEDLEIRIGERERQGDELIIIDNSAADTSSRRRARNRHLPPLTLLDEESSLALTPEEIDEKKIVIEQTLADFGLPALVTEIRRGPAVTQFGVTPGYVEKPGPDGAPKPFKVRVGQIAALQKDLALALAVQRLRIEAPVPGRGIVGVEVPNAQTSIVRLRPIIESEAFFKIKAPLAVAMGRDVTGSPVTANLGSLPHLLIAGTTGSGKSVCLNALITCLVLNNTPEQLNLIMIDPKQVELIRFNGLPHLLGKVEVEPERIIGVLRWLTGEMDRRYDIFAGVGAKNLADYNRKALGRRSQAPRVLPHVVIFIDELADLMAAFGAEVEKSLCRLAQMARATGMHLVVATQRPSTDVITGLIKANFPARASFAVTSNTDSRVILDTIGADQLLGKGDMLYLAPDASVPLRVQGCFVSDHEIEKVVEHWQTMEQGEQPDETPSAEAPWETFITRETFVSNKDEMLEDAIAIAQKNDKISTSLIQRKLRVGYPRAARLMEILYEMGLVEDPREGGKKRRTFVREEDNPLDDYLEQ